MKTWHLIFFVMISTSATGQVSSGKVESLVAAENYFAGIVKEKGIKKAFLMVSNEEAVIFRPGPVNVRKYFRKQDDSLGLLSWEPALAKISRSGDWGFTSGPYTYKTGPGAAASYGEYLSVWKTDKNQVWKLVLDIGVPHPKPAEEAKLIFSNPTRSKYFKQWSDNRLQQREDMVMITDNLFASTLVKYKNLAYNEFLSDDARFLFPGSQPIEGLSGIQDFLRNQEIRIVTQATSADRAFGGELAYTYGTSEITKNDKTAKYYYVRIWEVQNGKWYVILEVHSPAAD